MAKVKLTLIPEPTFTAKAPIPTPGKDPVDVEFTFKHRTRDEMERFVAQVRDTETPMDDVQMVLGCASGWELADPFTEENVREFARQYIAGPAIVFETYVAEMVGARRKNFVRPQP